MRIAFIVFLSIITILLIDTSKRIVDIYENIYPYKEEMSIYYQYKIIGNDTIPIDTIIFKKIK